MPQYTALPQIYNISSVAYKSNFNITIIVCYKTYLWIIKRNMKGILRDRYKKCLSTRTSPCGICLLFC